MRDIDDIAIVMNLLQREYRRSARVMLEGYTKNNLDCRSSMAE